jgi:hypothetical protein
MLMMMSLMKRQRLTQRWHERLQRQPQRHNDDDDDDVGKNLSLIL